MKDRMRASGGGATVVGIALLVVTAIATWGILDYFSSQIETTRSAIVEARPFPSAANPTLPLPTEIVKRSEDEEQFKHEREAWLESLHLAAPGVDWRAIEEANRDALIAERMANEKAQKKETAGAPADQWNEVGSANQAGRTHAAAWSPDDGYLYVGSDNGGVWRGTIDGQNWTPISDDIGYGSHGLLLVPGSPKVISTFNGDRLYATADDGGSWFVPEGFDDVDIVEIKRMVRDLGSPRTAYLLILGNHSDTGMGFYLYRSADGGQSYSLVHSEANWPQCDIWIDRRDPGPLYLLAGETMKVSYNLGQSFTAVGTIPTSVGSVILTGSEAGAPNFYASTRTSGDWELWRSTDGGVTWGFRYTINDYWETLCASITDPDLVLFAGVECFRSTDGGGSFTKVNDWGEYYGDPENKLHADNPGMDCIWIDGQELFFNNTDGGTYVSYDGVETVQNISLHGLGISQYYDIFTSSSDPYLIAAGAQDQGYQVSTPDGPRDPFLDFDQIISGDYGQMTSTVRDHNMLYSNYPGFILVQVTEEYRNLWFLDFPPASFNAWMPPMLADPLDPDAFYFCADHLWRYERVGATSNFEMTELPYDFAADGCTFVTGLAIAPSNTNQWYAVANNGLLWASSDAGASWTLSDSSGPGHNYLYGTSIVVSPTNPYTAYVGGSGYSNPAVYKTLDGGLTWEPMSSGLPSTTVYMLAVDGDPAQTLYAATEAGPYVYDALAGEWKNIMGTEAPMTTYWCVESVPELGVVRFGTYGRGIWDYTPEYVSAMGIVTGPGPGYDNPPQVRVFPPVQNGAAAYGFNAYGGSHFGANVSCGDVNGDDIDEILTGPGPGNIYGPHVRGFDLIGTPVPGLSFLAYGTNKYGVLVSGGDIDGDGKDEIITGAGPGPVFGPHVRAFNHDGGGSVDPVAGVSFFAYGTLKYGVNVAAGDIDDDGFDELVTGAGPGAVFGPHVRGWNVDGATAEPIQAVSYFAYETLKWGVRVACGDVDGDGIDEIVTAPGPGPTFGAHIRGWNYDGSAVSPIAGISFFAFDPSEARFGAKIYAGADVTGNGRDDLVVAPGPDPNAGTRVRVFEYEGGQVNEAFSLQAYPDGWATGANVAAGRF